MFRLIHHLIGRLSVSRKLILIYALDLSAVIFVSAILINEKYIAIDFARREIVGNAYISVLREAVLPLESGTTAAFSQQSAVAVISSAEQRFGEGLGSATLAQALVERLERPGRKLSASEVHEVAQPLQALITRIGNHSNLILDPDLDSYYTMSLVVLRFPELFYVANQLAWKATEVGRATTAAERSRRQTDYLIIEGRLDAIASGISTDYDEAIAAGGAMLKTKLGHSRERLLVAMETLRSEARLVALQMAGGDIDADLMKNQELNDALAHAWRDAGMALEELLDLRISNLFSRMWWHLGTASLLLMLILTVVYFVARMIAVPIRRLSEVAENVSQSADYALRAHWHSGDELGRLVGAFNGMLEKLDQCRRIEQELAASERAALAQRELIEAMPIPLMVTAIPRHEVLHANRPAHDWLKSQNPDPWIGSLEAPQRVRFFQQLSDTGVVDEFEALWHGPGEDRWAVLSARRLRYQDQDAVLTAFAPIGRIKHMEDRLALWAKVFEASSESIMVTNADREIVTVNRAFCRSTAYELSEVLGKRPDFMRSDHHSDAFFEQIWKSAGQRGSWQGELWLRRKSGESFPVWAVLNGVRDDDGNVAHFVAAFLDISERKESERRISHLAHHDTLTDLPNRALCLDRLGVAIQQAERAGRRVGVLFLDLDRFKNINDSLGHHIGDGLLRSVARSLLDAVRAGDTVSRLGGDEFVVIFNGVSDADEIRQVVHDRMIPLLRRPHDVDGALLHVSCSVGIAVYPEDGDDVETLMRNADAAMYQAKLEGRNNAQFFTAEMDRCARERMEIEQDLGKAIERNELRLYFQPRVNARTGSLLGVEALVRWLHPKRGLVSPSTFIPVAEECGLIVPIGYWIFCEACRQQVAWRDSGFGDIPVSVNLSVAQFRDEGLLDSLDKALRTHGVDPARIELELTESILMEDVGSTVELLHRIKALGVSLSIDDFGTGYSSLNYLYRFPIDKLKIDQSFVSDMLDDPKDLAITQAIIGLGHTLDLGVVAEGVENVLQARALHSAGCDELQGYHYSRPLPADELVAWQAARAAAQTKVLVPDALATRAVENAVDDFPA